MSRTPTWLFPNLKPEELEQFERSTRRSIKENQVIEKMAASGAALIDASGQIDIWLCLQVGVALLMDKPLIIVHGPGFMVPARLRQLADLVIEGNMHDPQVMQAVALALKNAAAKAREQ